MPLQKFRIFYIYYCFLKWEFILVHIMVILWVFTVLYFLTYFFFIGIWRHSKKIRENIYTIFQCRSQIYSFPPHWIFESSCKFTGNTYTIKKLFILNIKLIYFKYITQIYIHVERETYFVHNSIHTFFFIKIYNE
jgi:hypothetical protein